MLTPADSYSNGSSSGPNIAAIVVSVFFIILLITAGIIIFLLLVAVRWKDSKVNRPPGIVITSVAEIAL